MQTLMLTISGDRKNKKYCMHVKNVWLIKGK